MRDCVVWQTVVRHQALLRHLRHQSPGLVQHSTRKLRSIYLAASWSMSQARETGTIEAYTVMHTREGTRNGSPPACCRRPTRGTSTDGPWRRCEGEWSVATHLPRVLPLPGLPEWQAVPVSPNCLIIDRDPGPTMRWRSCRCGTPTWSASPPCRAMPLGACTCNHHAITRAHCPVHAGPTAADRPATRHLCTRQERHGRPNLPEPGPPAPDAVGYIIEPLGQEGFGWCHRPDDNIALARAAPDLAHASPVSH